MARRKKNLFLFVCKAVDVDSSIFRMWKCTMHSHHPQSFKATHSSKFYGCASGGSHQNEGYDELSFPILYTYVLVPWVTCHRRTDEILAVRLELQTLQVDRVSLKSVFIVVFFFVNFRFSQSNSDWYIMGASYWETARYDLKKFWVDIWCCHCIEQGRVSVVISTFEFEFN